MNSINSIFMWESVRIKRLKSKETSERSRTNSTSMQREMRVFLQFGLVTTFTLNHNKCFAMDLIESKITDALIFDGWEIKATTTTTLFMHCFNSNWYFIVDWRLSLSLFFFSLQYTLFTFSTSNGVVREQRHYIINI